MILSHGLGMVLVMIEPTPTVLPSYGVTSRPAWLVRFAHAAASASVADGGCTEWPQQLTRACDEMQATGNGSPDPAESNCIPRPTGQLEPLSSNTDRDIAMAGELLGAMVSLISSPLLIDELCRNAYPGRWDAALDEYAANPERPGDPDPILYDHSVALASLYRSGPSWPTGIDHASEEVMDFAHCVGLYSSHGLGLAHAAPRPVAWPPPEAPPALTAARHALCEALAATPVGQDEHTAMLFAYLAARDDPGLPAPTLVEKDQVGASVRDWGETVVPAAMRLAAATYAHAWEWASTDPQRWDLGVMAVAYAEAYLSVHHLRQVTDALDLADVACRSYAWRWCQDRKLDLASLRELAITW